MSKLHAIVIVSSLTIAAATAIDLVALAHGINGTVTHSTFGVIGGVTGFALKAIFGRKKEDA